MDNILEKIYGSALKFLEPLNTEETYQIITTEAMKLVKAEYVSIFLENNGELERVFASSPVLYSTKVRKRGYTYRAFKTQTAYVLDVNKVSKIHPIVKERKVKSIIFIPLFYKNLATGVLSVDTLRKENFSEKDLQILKLFGSLASLAIRKSQLSDETKKALEIRDLFIAMAAHELRTPLTTISGYIQLLLDKLPKNDSAESRWIYQLSRESKRLTNLVAELLEVNRIKTGLLQYEFKECSLRDILSRTITNFELIHPDRKIVLKDLLKNSSDWVIGDFEKLLQVVINLLDNAAKFSAPETEIEIILKCVQANLIIEVKDQGKGIHQKDQSKIFEGFYKGQNNDTEQGMGLGLYLVRNIVEEHRGTIKVASKLGKGTKIEIKLPRIKYE